jgi:sterol 24-C-methyltransferase
MKFDSQSTRTGILAKIQLFWYRFVTAIKALWTVYFMPQDKIDAFMKSYTLFEQDAMSANNAEENLLRDYYGIINELCCIGEVEKMYIPPKINANVGIFENQLLFEEKMIKDLKITGNSKVLDIGCGRGRVAAHIATASGGASVRGINIDPTQLAKARAHAESILFLNQRLAFTQGNFNNPLPYADESFDALYQIQVLTYAKDMDVLAQEMFRVLKDGGRISFLDWVVLPRYDPNNAHHVSLVKRIKPLIGAVTTPTPKDFESSLEKAGFRVLFSGDASPDGHQAELIERACAFYEFFTMIINTLVFFRILPKHFKILFDRLTKDGDAFVEADELGICTTSYQIIAEKPSK